jgi:propionyl-CoA synthetase
MGRIAARLPLPPGCFSTLFRADDRYLETYFSRFPGHYDTMDAGTKDADGYIKVMARDDDVINVAGHRLSTGALEEVLLGHPGVADAAVIGVNDALKGQVPLGLIVPRAAFADADLEQELVARVRADVGAVAAFRMVVRVEALPRTRSGKTARKTISDLANGKAVKIPPTIEDPGVYAGIKRALNRLGYALGAPDPA